MTCIAVWAGAKVTNLVLSRFVMISLALASNGGVPQQIINVWNSKMKANMGLQACNTYFLLPVILDNHGMLRADQSFLIVLTL